ncbi:MAG: hypothetical protein ACTSR8_03250 [Promethearchaeota archaeon]
MTDIQAQLKEHLDNGADWEKMETPIEGVFVVKIPATKTRPALLHIEINPMTDDGKPMKRKGLFVGNLEMLMKFNDAITDDKVFQLMKELEQVNPDIKSNSPSKKLKM